MTDTAAKKITYDGKPVQVESAIRDGTCKIINQTYLEKYKTIEFNVPMYVETGEPLVIARYNGTYSGTPGYVIFTIEVSEPNGGPSYGIYTFLMSWAENDGKRGITLLGSSGDRIFDYIYLDGYATGPQIAVKLYDDWAKIVKITVYASTDELEWLTEWDTVLDYNYIWEESVDFQYSAQIEFAEFSAHADTASKAYRDGQNNVIDVSYVKHAEYTVTVSTSQQYHKSFSDLALGTNSAGQARKPRLVEIFDASGNRIYTDVTIDTTNSRVTIYPTTISPAQTWTVRVTAW